MSDIFAELSWRQLISQTTDENLAAWLAKKPRTLYAGFDPTADSLHVGHLMALMILRRFQRAGHRPIALIGGATGMIGDPSGKSEERNLLSVETLEANIAGMQSQLERLLDFMPRYEVRWDGCRRVAAQNVAGWSHVPVRVLA